MTDRSCPHIHKAALLFITLHPESVSIDKIATLNISDISDLWLFIEKQTQDGVLERDSLKTAPSFYMANETEKKKILEDSCSEVWRFLFENTDIAEKVLSEKEFSLRKKFLSYAYIEFSPLSETGNEDPLAVKALVVTLYLKSLPTLHPEIQEKALKTAIRYGDTHSQAMLYSCVDIKMLSEGTENKMFDYFNRAKETAELQEDLTLTIHVMFSITSKMSLRGRLKEFISYSEELMKKIVPKINSTDIEKADFHLRKMIEGFNIYSTLISFNYYLSGNYSKSLSILHQLLEKTDKNEKSRFYESIRSYLANIYADQRMTEKAEYFSGDSYRYWTSSPHEEAFSWMTCITLASISMQRNDIRNVKKYLEKGQFFREKSGFYHHYGNILLDVLEWYEINKGEPIDGLNLDSELKRLFDWPDINMHGVARRYYARKLVRRKAKMSRIIAELEFSVELLEKAGAYPAMIESIDMLLEFKEHIKDHERINHLRSLKEAALEFIVGTVREDNAVERHELTRKRIINLIYDIGSLSKIMENSTNPWENAVNVIQSQTGCENCGIFEMKGAENRSEILTLAIQSANTQWNGAVRTFLISSGFPGTVNKESSSLSDVGFFNEGRLIIIPFSTKEYFRRYVLCMENNYTAPLITQNDTELLGILGLQLGVLTENINVWNDLQKKKLSLENENLYFRKQNPAVSGYEIIGESKAVIKMKDLIHKIAPLDSTTLITGETGTGKELIAREIYRNSSRKNGPFIAINIASTPGELIYSILFGHEKGAFTGAVKQSKGLFEMADGGTIFLDEIGDMGINDQVHLLRVLQEKTFKRIGSEKQIYSDFRLIASTNKNLLSDVRIGRFREDLYYRLNVFPINAPPLRERKDDIPMLADHFIKQFSRTMGKNFESIDKKGIELLMNYDWPGNIRELRHVIERSCIISGEPFLKIELFPEIEKNKEETFPLTLDETVRNAVISALKTCYGKIRGVDGAAGMLGIKPSTLYSKIKKLGIQQEIDKAKNRNRESDS